jgi:hypothetical protein
MMPFCSTGPDQPWAAGPPHPPPYIPPLVGLIQLIRKRLRIASSATSEIVLLLFIVTDFNIFFIK